MSKSISILLLCCLAVNAVEICEPKLGPKCNKFRPKGRQFFPEGKPFKQGTCAHQSFDELIIPHNGNLLQLRNRIRNKESCKENCDFFHNCKSYFYNRITQDCYILTTSFSDHSKRISRIGAPRDCALPATKIDECTPLEGNCDLEVDESVRQDDEIAYNVENCKQKCDLDELCMYYKVNIKDSVCLRFSRPTKSCNGFLGSSESVLKKCRTKTAEPSGRQGMDPYGGPKPNIGYERHIGPGIDMSFNQMGSGSSNQMGGGYMFLNEMGDGDMSNMGYGGKGPMRPGSDMSFNQMSSGSSNQMGGGYMSSNEMGEGGMSNMGYGGQGNTIGQREIGGRELVVDPFVGKQTSCNQTSFSELVIPHDESLIFLRNNMRSEAVCKKNCEFYPNCKSYFYNRRTQDCFIMKTDFTVHATRIAKIGAPANCLAKMDKCSPIEGHCDLEVEPEVEIDAKFTIERCQKKCKIDPACMYYEFVYKTKGCLLYKRPLKSCHSFLGSPDSVLKNCGKGAMTKKPVVVKPNPEDECQVCLYCIPDKHCAKMCEMCNFKKRGGLGKKGGPGKGHQSNTKIMSPNDM